MDKLGGPGEEKAHEAGMISGRWRERDWVLRSEPCMICNLPLKTWASASLKHIFSGCAISLAHGHCTWRHNQVLRELASTLRRTTVKKKKTPTNISRKGPLSTVRTSRPISRAQDNTKGCKHSAGYSRLEIGSGHKQKANFSKFHQYCYILDIHCPLVGPL